MPVNTILLHFILPIVKTPNFYHSNFAIVDSLVLDYNTQELIFTIKFIGTFAAFWQSSIGDVAAGSFFAWLQSAGMLGSGARIGSGIGVLVTFAGYLWVQVQKHSNEEDRKERNGAVRPKSLLHGIIRAGMWSEGKKIRQL